MAIKNVQSLRDHLQWAIELEHSTIPPYITALYSLHPGKNREAAGVLLSVAIEEMLHMTLVANVLNAIGGAPSLDAPTFMPDYPTFMPHSNKAFMVHIAPFSKETIATFLKIEKPEPAGAMPEDDIYESIGQFYDALEQGLVRLCEELGESAVFTGDPARQMTAENFHYEGSGNVVVVTDLASARRALEEIVEQGEGLDHQSIWDGDRSMNDPDREELSHYFRLNELYEGRYYLTGNTPQTGPTGDPFPVDWEAVYKMRPNPKKADYPEGSPARERLQDFHQAYCNMLRLMHRSFNGEPDCMAEAVGVMYEIKFHASALMQTPAGDGESTVGLGFEYAPPALASRKPKKITIRPNGPYIVDGGVTVRRKSRILSELREALSWRTEKEVETREPVALCRCGQSDSKPFCDGSHVHARFDGTEVAATNTRAERLAPYPGPKLTVKHDRNICACATFCENKITDVWEMAEKTDDIMMASQVIAMIERCPSGALTYELTENGETIEPDLPVEIAVVEDGPLWVMGGIPIQRADGQPIETRNRVTLCRCGGSKNKPFCDGTHWDIRFKG